MTPRVPIKQTYARATARRVRPRRDFAAMEARRMRAAELFEQGMIPAEIARQVGVRHQIVSEWRKAWWRAGRDGLPGAGRAGRKPKLNDEQLAKVQEALANGAEAHGYVTDLWTLPRVAEVRRRIRLRGLMARRDRRLRNRPSRCRGTFAGSDGAVQMAGEFYDLRVQGARRAPVA